ncbi:hypothetical protein VTN96DRAFT_7152 [Rasamsonia emersonii]
MTTSRRPRYLPDKKPVRFDLRTPYTYRTRSEHPCQRNAVPENGTVATVACQGGGQLRQFGKLEEAFLPGKVLAPHRERARRRAKAPARWAGMERRIPIF